MRTLAKGLSARQVCKVTEPQRLLSWKGPVRTVQCSSWACTGHPKSHNICLTALSRHFWRSDGLGEALPMLNHPVDEKVFVDIQPKPPLSQLQPFPQVTVMRGKRWTPAPHGPSLPLSRRVQTTRGLTTGSSPPGLQSSTISRNFSIGVTHRTHMITNCHCLEQGFKN